MFAGEQFDPVTGLYYLRARYMNPSVGTFISMDAYSGSIDEPVSLHKYLYANANPVSNGDPSGYMTLADQETSMGIQGVLNQIITPNAKALMSLFNGLSVVWDITDTARTAWNDGLRGEDLAISIACGVMTSILTNFSCQILALGPLGVAIFAVGALVLGIGIGMALAEGDGSLALSRVAQLVGVLFSAFAPSCFTGDTEVYTNCGMVCIEEIEVGDEVLAYNSETGETELKEVLNVWIKETDEILHVSTSDGENIDTTTNHPFYVDGKGWVAAGDLEIGDTLITADGNEVEVTDIEIEKLDEPILVYNLDVADFDTYFVGEYCILVHNYNPYGRKGGPKHRAKVEQVAQTYGTTVEEFMVELNSLSGSGKLQRFIDIAVIDQNGNPIKFFQVGRVTANGMPVKREFQAIMDILLHSDYGDIPIEFIPYF